MNTMTETQIINYQDAVKETANPVQGEQTVRLANPYVFKQRIRLIKQPSLLVGRTICKVATLVNTYDMQNRTYSFHLSELGLTPARYHCLQNRQQELIKVGVQLLDKQGQVTGYINYFDYVLIKNGTITLRLTEEIRGWLAPQTNYTSASYEVMRSFRHKMSYLLYPMLCFFNSRLRGGRHQYYTIEYLQNALCGERKYQNVTMLVKAIEESLREITTLDPGIQVALERKYAGSKNKLVGLVFSKAGEEALPAPQPADITPEEAAELAQGAAELMAPLPQQPKSFTEPQSLKPMADTVQQVLQAQGLKAANPQPPRNYIEPQPLDPSPYVEPRYSTEATPEETEEPPLNPSEIPCSDENLPLLTDALAVGYQWGRERLERLAPTRRPKGFWEGLEELVAQYGIDRVAYNMSRVNQQRYVKNYLTFLKASLKEDYYSYQGYRQEREKEKQLQQQALQQAALTSGNQTFNPAILEENLFLTEEDKTTILARVGQSNRLLAQRFSGHTYDQLITSPMYRAVLLTAAHTYINAKAKEQ